MGQKRNKKKAKLKSLLKQAKKSLVDARFDNAFDTYELIFEKKLIPKSERAYSKKTFKGIKKEYKKVAEKVEQNRDKKNISLNRTTYSLLKLGSKLEKLI